MPIAIRSLIPQSKCSASFTGNIECHRSQNHEQVKLYLNSPTSSDANHYNSKCISHRIDDTRVLDQFLENAGVSLTVINNGLQILRICFLFLEA